MRKLVILSGVSGSGKSRYAGKLLGAYTQSLGMTDAEMVRAPLPLATSAYCNADGFFMSDGVYNFNPAKLSLAHGKCFREFIRAVQGNTEMVVVDNTNTTVEEISPYVLGGQAYDYDVEIHTLLACHAELEMCAQRNAHGVPYQGILSQYTRIGSRRLPPWWNHTAISLDSL